MQLYLCLSSNLMADIVDGLKSRGLINTAAAHTVELDTSREDIRMTLDGLINRVAEDTLEVKSALHLLLALVLVGLASGIVAAIARAVIDAASLDARGIAVAGLVAGLADLDRHEVVVGHGELRDLRNHAINAEADLALSLESTEVGGRRITLIVVLGKSVRDKVLRDSSRISSEVHLADLASVGGILEETGEGLSLEAEITVLAGDGGRGLLSIVVRILEDGAEIDAHAVIVDGGDPAMRPARSDIGAELGILKASIRGSSSRSRGGNVDVLRELLLVPHGTRIAGRHEEDKLLEHLLAGPGINAGGEIVIVEELVSGHGDDTRATVIIVEDEDVIVLSRLEDLARARGSGLASENIDEVLNSSILGDVILHNALIDVDVGATLNVELVEDLTREGVLRVVGDIILEESDDTLVGDTSLVGKLVSLAHGGLVTIVAPASATGDKDDPGVATLGLAALNSLLEHVMLRVRKSDCNKSKSHKESLHYSYSNTKKVFRTMKKKRE